MLINNVILYPPFCNIVHYLSAIQPSQDFMEKGHDKDVDFLSIITNINMVASKIL